MATIKMFFFGLFLLGITRAATAYTWDGGGTDDLLVTQENWDGDIAPMPNTTSDSDVIFTGNVRTSPLTSVADQSYRTVSFDAGAAAFTFGGTTEFIFNATGSSTNNSTNDSAFTQTFDVDVAMRRADIFANTGDWVFNNRVRLFTTNSTINGPGNVFVNAGFTGDRALSMFGDGTLLVSAASTGWTGAAVPRNGAFEISHNDALGDPGDRSASYTQIQSSATGATGDAAGGLVLSGGIDVPEYIYMDVRNAFNAHIRSKSGSNTLTGNANTSFDAIELENGNGPAIEQNHYALQSDGTDVGDLFTISGNIVVTTEEAAPLGFLQLALQGAGNGVVSGNIGAGAGGLTNVTPLDIVKNDGGTWTLSGSNNTYTGDTYVNDGTLSITNAFLADAADVYLTSGATLNLDFTAGSPDTIDSLFIDSVSQATGTWGAMDSGADHKTPWITGSGMLLVSKLSVPEPATCAFALCAMLGVLSVRRYRGLGAVS